MLMKLTGNRKASKPIIRQPFIVILKCQDCDTYIEIGDELIDVQVDVTKTDEGLNQRRLLVVGPDVCPKCKNIQVVRNTFHHVGPIVE